MNENFVPYKESLELKNLGYFGEYFAVYDNEKFTRDFEIFQKQDFSKVIRAPLYEQAFKWIREKYKLFPETSMYIVQEGKYDGTYAYKAIIKDVENYKEIIIFEKDLFPTIEKAKLECLREIINIKIR